MKIMFLVPMINTDDIESYKRNKAGLAYTTRAIVEKLAEFGHDISVYAQSGFSDGLEIGRICYERKKLFDIFPISMWYISEFFKDTSGCKMSLKRRIHALSHYLYGPYVERLLKKNKPDIVSIRGIGYYTKPLINACERTNTKYIVSLHGLISFLDESLVTNKEASMEKELFRRAIEEEKPVTVIATGIKTRMLKEFRVESCNNVMVVNNGIDRNNQPIDKYHIEEIRTKYNISKNDKVIISAAHITARKNQIQILRSYLLLPEDIRNTTKLLFLGDGDQKQGLEEMVRKHCLSNSVFFCGFIPNDQMGDYFSLSDVNVIASLDEGFGRAFVEAFLYGIPTVTFSDLDAVQDLYSPEAMICVDERSDEALASALQNSLTQPWCKEKIINHGKLFSVENMARKYEDIYKRYLNGKL